MITKLYNLLSVEECQHISDKIKSIPENLFHYNKAFKVLGTTLYGSKTFNDYVFLSKKRNKILQNGFQNMYDKIKQCLSDNYKCEVAYNTDLSLPGFQIYSYSEQHNINPARVWHYDDEKLGFPVRPVDSDITITLLIENPGKCTYNYFPCTHSYYTKDSHTICSEHIQLNSYTKCTNPNCELTDDKMETVEYDVGMMLITQDRYLHRIGPTDFYDKSKQRITLQGHGYFKNNKLYLHW